MNSRRHYGLVGTTAVAIIDFSGASLLMGASKPPKERKDKDKTKSALKVGDKAPEFKLKDTEGKEHSLSDYTKAGKVVVLEWFNPGCPFIKLHHVKQTTMNDLVRDFKEKNVVFLAINSTNSEHPDHGKDAEAKKDWKMEYPILSDANGRTGHAYGARTTPHMFVIDKEGKIAYMGAMDNDPRNEKTADAEKPEDKKVNYVRAALTELLAGKKVSKSETRSYGCGVKY